MLLGILSIIALSVGTLQTAIDLSESERLALEEQKPAMVQIVDPAENKNIVDPEKGL
jgi:hypothetical protein